jgi:hypothetical protein
MEGDTYPFNEEDPLPRRPSIDAVKCGGDSIGNKTIECTSQRTGGLENGTTECKLAVCIPEGQV